MPPCATAACHYIRVDWIRGRVVPPFVTAAAPALPPAQVNIISRLEFAFSQVDLDHSNTLDFYEFVYLSFMMTQVAHLF